MNLLELQDKTKLGKDFSFRVKVSPGANKTEWQEPLSDDIWRLKVKSAPEKGRANAEVIEFIALFLGVNKKRVEITGGGGARLKRIRVKKA